MTSPAPLTCPSGKQPFGSPQLANKALVAILAHRHRRPKQWIRQAKPVAYKCRMCGAWHVSSGSKPTERPGGVL